MGLRRLSMCLLGVRRRVGLAILGLRRWLLLAVTLRRLALLGRIGRGGVLLLAVRREAGLGRPRRSGVLNARRAPGRRGGLGGLLGIGI